jgi:hypothetical protein
LALVVVLDAAWAGVPASAGEAAVEGVAGWVAVDI